METLVKNFFFPRDKINSIKKTLLTILQFFELPLQWIQTLHLKDRRVKILSGINIDLRQNRILRGRQPIVNFDAADNFRFYVTSRKAINFQDGIPSIPIGNFKDHFVLVFDFTSVKDATENCHYPELVGEPLRLELNFPLNTLLNSLYWEKEFVRLQLTWLVPLEK